MAERLRRTNKLRLATESFFAPPAKLNAGDNRSRDAHAYGEHCEPDSRPFQSRFRFWGRCRYSAGTLVQGHGLIPEKLDEDFGLQ